MYSNLINHIKAYVNLQDKDEEIITNHVSPSNLKNKEYLLEDGQICKSYFFVEQGCLRMFFINDKGTEQITHFALENWWISDYHSFISQRPSEYYIQAIEKSTVLTIDHQAMNYLLKEIPVLESYFRIMSERALAASQVRIKLLYSLSKEELFLHFSKAFPDFVQRVPQYMLASFLGLTPEYLSEIRKKKQ